MVAALCVAKSKPRCQSVPDGGRSLFARVRIPAVVGSVAWFLIHWLSLPAAAQGPLRDSFEGPESSWRAVAADARYRFDARRVQGAAHSGDWCEQISVRADNGSFVYAGHAIEPARVIPELKPSVWIKSNRAGLSLLARVVLPHTVHPRTAKPATVLVSGTQYTASGQWQRVMQWSG